MGGEVNLNPKLNSLALTCEIELVFNEIRLREKFDPSRRRNQEGAQLEHDSLPSFPLDMSLIDFHKTFPRRQIHYWSEHIRIYQSFIEFSRCFIDPSLQLS